jgi:hypothetical protein
VKLETPFEAIMNMFTKKVIRLACPMCDPKWPDKISDMLRLGWGVSPKDRSSMDAVCATCVRKSNPRRTKKQTRSWMLSKE